MARRIAAICSLLFTATLFAQSPDYTAFRATPLRAIDGDTIEVSVYVGLDIYTVETIRLLCVNTPETHGPKAAAEKPAGLKAFAFTKTWIDRNPQLTLRIRKDGDRDAYGRLLGFVYASSGDVSLNQALLDAGHATLYMCAAKDMR